MVSYNYDGSFDGLLTAVFDSYSRRERIDVLSRGVMLQTNLFSDDAYSVMTE